MFHQSSKQILLGIFVALLLITMPVYAVKNFKISDYGGAHQVWFEAEDFDERDPPTNQYYSVVDADGAFGKAINRGGPGGMIRWTFDISAADGKGGTWYFWGRVIIPNNHSDFMIVEGDPGDPALPTGPPYNRPSDAEGFTDAQRAFDQNLGPPWTWGRSGHQEAHIKQLQDGENTMYIVPREGGNTDFWDVFMWTDNPVYVPTDEDYRNAKAFVFVPGAATNPSPANEAIDVPREVVLSWTPGSFAAPTNGHTVYFSESFEDVNAGIGGIAQSDTSYAPPQRLDFGTTYYWRIDEVNGPPDYTVYKSEVWSFTAEPFAYPIENITATASSSTVAKGPENTINGSGLDDSGLLHGKDGDNNMWLSGITGPQPTWIQYEFDKVYKLHEMWVWNSNEGLEPVIGFGLKDVTIEYSTNGTDYTTLGTTHEFAKAPGLPDYTHNTIVDFGGAAVKYVRLTANSNWGGIMPQFGLSEVRFLYIPVVAREPDPASGATDVDLEVVLSWRAGREAATHDVYVSTDEQAVIDGTVPATTVTETSHGPLSLDLGTTYYWKVNEVNEAETLTTWESNIWNFTISEYLVVDDFESYNDLDTTDPESNRIFLTWIDGYEQPTNGSIIGYEAPPFAEQSIVHSGNQSMPLAYSNTGGAASSEAELLLSPPQNWTQAGAATLVLYFHGADGNTGQLYIKIDGSKVVYDGDVGDVAKSQWNQWSIDLASLSAGVQNVTKLAIGIDGNGATGTLYVDDIRLYRLAPQPEAP